MGKILTYNEIDTAAWQALIDSSPYATWFQTREAYEFYASVPEEMVPFAVGVTEDEQLMGVVVGYSTKEQNPIKQLFTCRSIIVGGPLLHEHISDCALSALLLAVKRVTSDSIFVETRNFHDYSLWKDIFHEYGFRYYSHLNFHVDCSRENILSSMSESRRRQIKKAIKNGANIVEANSISEVKNFYIILANLYKNKIKTPLFKLEFFLNFYQFGYGKFLLIKHNGIIIGGIMCPILGGKAIYEWFVCGLDDEYREQYPSVMATYAALEYAKQNNLPLFDFMGAGKPDEAYGVRDFKARFGGELVEHGRFLCIRKPLRYWIGKLGVTILKKR